MNFEEFLEKKEDAAVSMESVESEAAEESVAEGELSENIDVQKAVVEALAADKAEQDEKISELRAENDALKAERDSLKNEVETLKRNILSLEAKLKNAGKMAELNNEVLQLRAKCSEQAEALKKVGDVLSINSETPLSNKVSLLDRDIEIPDRFSGETREHVLEVIAEARKKAEAEGRLRRAQVLEGVLIANESEGTLVERRSKLEKLFSDNANILSGPVIEQLEKMGISHKDGENYLLPAEIIKRTY
jgi:cell division protein FtsB